MTSLQEKILTHSAFGKIYYQDMYKSQHILGYSEPGDSRYYDIYVAKDIPSEIREIVLVHEVGHIYYGHLDIDIARELETVKGIFQKHNKDFDLIHKYGGFFTFLNICMDLEVNSKALTISNINTITTLSSVVTPDAFNVPVLSSFRDYYEPLIEKLKNVNGVERDLNRMFGQPEIPEDLKDMSFQKASEQDAELQKALEQEGYRRRSKNKPEEQDLLSILGTSIPQEEVPIPPNNNTTIKNFLYNILKTSQDFFQDSFKQYNRGTRQGNILYPSLRLRDKTTKKKLGVIIDISSSMDVDSIMQALGTLKRSPFLSPESLIVFCNNDVSSSHLITKLPERVSIGGGTDLSRGVKFLAEKGFKDCCIYSDMYTDIDRILKLKKEFNLNLYTIIVRDQRDKKLDNYLQENEKYLFVTNIH